MTKPSQTYYKLQNSVISSYDKLQYKQNEVEFFGETYIKWGHKPSKEKLAAIHIYAITNQQETSTILYWND